MGRVRVVPDEASSSLLVTANVHLFAQVSKMIEEMDVPPAQVLIDARLVQVSANYLDQIGVRFSPDASQVFTNDELVDLEGNPLLDDKTGKPITKSRLIERSAPAWHVAAHFDRESGPAARKEAGYLDDRRFFNTWRMADKTLWYLTHDGRVVGYDSVTRRQTGSFGVRKLQRRLACSNGFHTPAR